MLLLKTFAACVGIVFVALVAIRLLNISYPLTVTTYSSSGELAVVGEGKVDATPDTAIAEVGITVADSPTVEAVQKQINTTNNEIIASVAKLGVKKADVKTSNYSVYPNYTYEGGGPGKITGYAGNVTISIKVTDTSNLSQVIQAATEAGANQIYSTQFVIENPEKYREEARNKAIENAQQQAEQLAKRLGIRLGKVTNVVESSVTSPVSYAADRMYGGGGVGAGGGAPSPDLESGTQTVTSTVTLYFQKQ